MHCKQHLLAALFALGTATAATAQTPVAANAAAPASLPLVIWVPLVNPAGGWPLWVPMLLLPPLTPAAAAPAPLPAAAPAPAQAMQPATGTHAEPPPEPPPAPPPAPFAPPEVDLGPVAPTPVVPLGDDAAAVPAPPPARPAPPPKRKKPVVRRAAPAAKPVRRLCWDNGIVKPCK